MNELLSIGEFSARCGLSAKMLRSYAGIGLLVPAAVDAWSGYRYYSTGQLHRARVIGLLRQAGVAVDDIARYFADPSAERWERWDREIVESSDSRRKALAEARAALLAEVSPAHPPRKGFVVTSTLQSGATTHTGGRERNQDATLVAEGLFAVADGIGGFVSGDVASRLALDTLESAFAADRTTAGLLEAARRANEVVWEKANADGTSMGTTVVALGLTDDVGAVVLHVGDSRLYRLRDERLEQLTQDHNVPAELLRTHQVTDEEARNHPHRHVLTRAIGVGPEVEVDHAGASVKPGDRLLLCTDGLFNTQSPDELRDLLASGSDPQRTCDDLVEAALTREADDNVTALVLDVQ
ncbi:protein phosphatase 2C domain-containing protein [Saccharopolyspora dendranthemae]|uniref:Serine/threonine protein phosphatase PrpC n=1 Tax=Saccharopolyspora dendranthemae TaxID=1181886 RepID=A0A561U109_9PSEU|nr:protein phosphatase 2C domain-containing protein [Saccharopolyspora dendranthemae]TWF93052.1 serine/threonine protein phosphatase PrpC [Saccharopolyspora dendranthemae]